MTNSFAETLLQFNSCHMILLSGRRISGGVEIVKLGSDFLENYLEETFISVFLLITKSISTNGGFRLLRNKS